MYLIHVFFIDWAAVRLAIFSGDEIMGIKVPIIINIPLRILIVWGISYFVVYIYQKIKQLIIER